jgi:hypothetical protein
MTDFLFVMSQLSGDILPLESLVQDSSTSLRNDKIASGIVADSPERAVASED